MSRHKLSIHAQPYRNPLSLPESHLASKPRNKEVLARCLKHVNRGILGGGGCPKRPFTAL
jgi:hypothetical protein